MLQKEVAEQLGVCQPSVINWEVGNEQSGNQVAIMLVGQSDSLLASRRSSRAQVWRPSHVDT